MKTRDAIGLALSQLRVQKLKSAFTLLGVTIGVMFLIAVVSIVEGMGRYVEEDFAGRLIGANTFTLRRFDNVGRGGPRSFDARSAARRPLIRMPDVDAVRSTIPATMNSAISSESFTYATAIGARPKQIQTVATEASYFAIKKFNIAQGRAFTEQEVRSGSPVVVIGTEVAEHFFPGLTAEGRQLRIGGTPFTVIGVVEKQGSVFGFSLDRLAIAPYTSAMGASSSRGATSVRSSCRPPPARRSIRAWSWRAARCADSADCAPVSRTTSVSSRRMRRSGSSTS